jgi:hypothetical protein
MASTAAVSPAQEQQQQHHNSFQQQQQQQQQQHYRRDFSLAPSPPSPPPLPQMHANHISPAEGGNSSIKPPGGSQQQLKCPHCNKILTTSVGLMYHIRLHTGQQLVVLYLLLVFMKLF